MKPGLCVRQVGKRHLLSSTGPCLWWHCFKHFLRHWTNIQRPIKAGTATGSTDAEEEKVMVVERFWGCCSCCCCWIDISGGSLLLHISSILVFFLHLLSSLRLCNNRDMAPVCRRLFSVCSVVVCILNPRESKSESLFDFSSFSSSCCCLLFLFFSFFQPFSKHNTSSFTHSFPLSLSLFLSLLPSQLMQTHYCCLLQIYSRQRQQQQTPTRRQQSDVVEEV